MRELIERLETLTEAKKRLSKYGEVHRKKVGEHTVVVRGIWQARKGDSYHVRILKGDGLESDETKRGNVLSRADFYMGDHGDEKKTLEAALAAAASADKRGKMKKS